MGLFYAANLKDTSTHVVFYKEIVEVQCKLQNSVIVVDL